MTRFRFIFPFLLLLSLPAWAQNLELIDSLHSQLRKAEGNAKVDLLSDLAWEYRFAYPDSTIAYAQQAYDLGKELKISVGLAEPLNFIGVAYNYKGERLRAFEWYDLALKTADSQHDTAQIAYANNNLGRLFFEQGLLSRSYNYFIQALALFETINDSSGLAYTYQSLASLYKVQHDFAKSESSYLKAYSIRLSLGNTRDIMSALVYVGRLYQEYNQHDKALAYLHKADSAGHVINDEINLADIKISIAESYLSNGRLAEAEAMCAEGLKVIAVKNNIRLKPQAFLTMGQIKLAKKNYGQAKFYFDGALDVASRTRDLTSKMEAHFWLWKLSEKQNDRGGQLRNQNEYLILKDSIKDLDVARQVERLQFEIEIERKEQENELLKVSRSKNEAIIQQQKLENIILLVIIGFVSILGIVQWRNSKKRRETNDKLAQQNQFIQSQREEIILQNEKLSRRNQELSDLNHEKDTLMSIVAHDLKSPLNRIKGIADLQELEAPLTENQKLYVRLTKEVTQSGLDLITDLLDVHMIEENVVPNYATFDISAFLLEKTESLRASAEGKEIHLHITQVENMEVTLDPDYLHRIVDNLITNAIKFSKKNSTIDVAAGTANHHLWISIKDQGPGFSDKDKVLLFQKFKKLSARPTGGESSNGLGLAIVKTLVDRLKGTIELNTEPGRGSEFVVKFPRS